MNLKGSYRNLIFKIKNFLFCNTSMLQVITQVVLLSRVAAEQKTKKSNRSLSTAKFFCSISIFIFVIVFFFHLPQIKVCCLVLFCYFEL